MTGPISPRHSDRREDLIGIRHILPVARARMGTEGSLRNQDRIQGRLWMNADTTRKADRFRNPWIPRILCCGFLGIGMMGIPGYASDRGGPGTAVGHARPDQGGSGIGGRNPSEQTIRRDRQPGAAIRGSWKERVRFATEGDVYHSNLLTYSVMAGVGLSQTRFSSDERSMNETDTLDEYNAVFQFLKMKPYPMTLLLNKSQDLISRPYQGPLQNDKESTGFSVSSRSLDLPMRFQYTVDESNQYPWPILFRTITTERTNGSGTRWSTNSASCPT